MKNGRWVEVRRIVLCNAVLIVLVGSGEVMVIAKSGCALVRLVVGFVRGE